MRTQIISKPILLALTANLAISTLAVRLPAEGEKSATWDRNAAASYLDQRTASWVHGMGALDHGTFCVSCHTALPYAISRIYLRKPLGETGLSSTETLVLEGVKKRVKLGNQVTPYLGNKDQGPGVESVLNALVLSTYECSNCLISDDTRHALDVMWAQQTRTGERAGTWPWFGDGGGGEQPWEAYDSQYWGAALAAVTVGTLPEEYRAEPPIQDNLKLLRAYLQKGRTQQSLLNRLSLLWAAEKLPGILTADQKAAIVTDLLAKQHQDGGWNTSELAVSTWKRGDGTPQETKSDGYATGMAAFVIQQAGVPSALKATRAARQWLVENQDHTSGSWPAYSLNKKRDPSSEVGKFMSDAATAFSVMALMSAR